MCEWFSKTHLTEFMTYQKCAKTSGIPPDLTTQELVDDKKGGLKLEDDLVTDKPHCKMLGITLQNNLTWDAQLSTVKKAVLPAVRKVIGMISRLRESLTFKARLHLINSLAISKYTYMISMWGNTTPNHQKKAQTVLNLAVRMITGCPKTTRQQDLMDKCNWMNTIELTRYHSLLQFCKLVRWRIPSIIAGKITLDNENNCITDKPRLQITAGYFRYKTSQTWNSLPQNLRSELSIAKFKSGLKLWIRETRLNGSQGTDATDEGITWLMTDGWELEHHLPAGWTGTVIKLAFSYMY